MTHKTIEAETRTIIGNSVRKLRKTGLVPAVVYGNSIENLNIQIAERVFLKLYKETGKTTVIDLNLDNKQKIPCLVQELDVDPVKGTLRHLDFLAVNLNQVTEAVVPLHFVGEPSKTVHGVVIKQANELEVEALPDNIPHSIEIDLSKLQEIGDTIFVKDLPENANYKILNEEELSIVTFVEEEEKEEVSEVVATDTMAPTTTVETPTTEKSS